MMKKKDSYKACSGVPVRDARDEDNERKKQKQRPKENDKYI